ncbi:MAG: ZIP family metal transporter [Actinobacteria bacterium]|nr:ZIP family metal transporter [Actinomycetota bacterium]
MSALLYIIIVTVIAGVGGTGLGGIIGALFKSDSSKTASLLLSFAAGVMLSIVCFDLVTSAIYPESASGQTDILFVIGAMALGVAVVYALNYVIDRSVNKEVVHITKDHPKTADDLDELIHSDHLATHMLHHDSKSSLFVAGLVMAGAIALHNVPEGMVIGASFSYHDNILVGSALALAILIGLHNIPEGMSIAVPLINGGMGRLKAMGITALSGLPTAIGGILGFWMGEWGSLWLSLSLGFAGGAMLYVVFGEILPQAILLYRSKLPAFFTIIGMLLGLLIIYM